VLRPVFGSVHELSIDRTLAGRQVLSTCASGASCSSVMRFK
jgi:hypothetical protein